MSFERDFEYELTNFSVSNSQRRRGT